MPNIPDSTYGICELSKRGMHANQEVDNSLNYSNDTLFLTPIYLSFFATKQAVLFIEAVPVSTSYCLPSLLATANQMSRFCEAPNTLEPCI